MSRDQRLVSCSTAARLVGRALLTALAALSLLAGGPLTTHAEETGDGAVSVTIDAATLAKLAAAKKAGSSSKSKKFRDFKDVTEGAKQYDGLFKLYEKDNHVYAAIKNSQMNMPLLAPITIAKGLASAGMPLNFGEEWVLMFRRVDDRVFLIRKNVRYEAPKGTPIGRAVEQNYLDSVLMSIPIVSDNPPGGGVLIDLNNIFFTDFAQLGLGSLDRSRTQWHKVKAFKNNIELQVQATYRSGFMGFGGFFDSGVIDPRGMTVVMHYSLAKRPGPGYKPRLADQRVGHFLNATKDFGSKDPDTIFKRRINRWRLEKANPAAKLSPPKKQVVWWVENTVPHEYRPYVEEGILEWNKAFEKIGFRNALGVRWQQEGDEFDPEDINYCTFRWVTTPSTFAMSGLRSDPITGEMIDGDVVFDASWIRYWKREYALMVGMPLPGQGEGNGHARPVPLDVGDVISPMLAAKQAYGSPNPPPSQQMHQHHNHPHDHGRRAYGAPHVVPSSWSPLQTAVSRRLNAGLHANCSYGLAKRQEFRLAALAFAANQFNASEDEKSEGDAEADDDEGTESEDDKEKKVVPAEIPEELIRQLIKEIVMHEVGHSLGLRHNFRASTMLSLDEINDKSITSEKGLSGSVMDYTPINIAADPEEQGHFASPTIGPYDYWAIEYAYKPVRGNEAKELAKIAARSPEADLAYATDEDLWGSNDPRVNVYDLGDDPLRYAKHRMALADRLLVGLDDNVVEDGESWARLRSAFSALIAQYGNAAYLSSNYIGGQKVAKHHRGGEETPDPIAPVSGDRQREALQLIADRILSDDAFHFSPQTLRRLTSENWYHWGSRSMMSPSGGGYPVYNTVLSIQRIALNHCLSASVLNRLQNQALMAEEDDEPLAMDELFSTLTESVWSEVMFGEEGAPEELELSVIRRNLQREHLGRLGKMIVGERPNPMMALFAYVSFSGMGGSYPADAKSLARMHLHEIAESVESALEAEGLSMDDLTRSHLMDTAARIETILDADLQANAP
ncbi:MAG: zinc-dependent metalloprotease [Planctomycetota bacterium]